MWALRDLVRALKHAHPRWERIGAWDGSGWNLRESSEGLRAWLSHQERRDSDIWSLAVEEGRQISIRGEHFEYRLVPRGDGLTIERKPM